MPRATALPPDERRTQILDATEPLLREHGRKVSVRQIAESAEIAEGTIFRVFDSKEDLIDQTLSRAFGAEPTVRQLEQIDPELGLEDRLVAITEVLQTKLRTTFALLHAVGPPPTPTAAGRNVSREEMFSQNKLIADAAVRLLDRDQDRLVLTPEQLIQLLTTVTLTVTHPMLARSQGTVHLSTDPRALVDLVLHGALADSGRRGPAFDHRSAVPSEPFHPCGAPQDPHQSSHDAPPPATVNQKGP